MADLVDRLNAALEGRYRIEREIGEGGMATVYLARDLRHHRSVAFKVMRPELAAAVGPARFLAEIRTTANLQHPHILPLHDSGEADALVFYTMPYVEGETLRDRLEREGRLPVEDAVEIAADVADALQVAHERGVVHRDIKPSNILLSRGKALVADFGIAKAAGVSDGTRLTHTGSSLGTVGYMSPEQASGEEDVDHRADIYSLGCVLHEMLVGKPPYAGGSVIQVLLKQATEPVPSVRGERGEVPATIDGAVARALKKERDDRFESAAAFGKALLSSESVTPKTNKPRAKSILVLPFVNRSPDPDTEYFSDGLTDEVISDLSRVSALRVISRNSSMTLKDTGKDTPTLARELGVTHLVTGTVRRAGIALRVTADLVEGSSDRPIWSEKFSGTMDDVFGIQEEISRQIVTALEVTLTEAEERGVGERAIDDPVAYDSYLRARHAWFNWTPEDQFRAERLVDDALEVVGDSPLLLATKAHVIWHQVNIHVTPADEGLARASTLVDRALALDPEQYLAIHVRGVIAGLRGQPERALVDVYRAHELRPDDPNVLEGVIRFSTFAGVLNARRFVDRVVEVDPLNPWTILHRAMNAFIYGPCEEAAAPIRRAMALAPPGAMHHFYGAWPLAAAGFPEEAAEVLGRFGNLVTDNVHGPFAFFLKHALEGNEKEALRVATPEMEGAIHNDIACRMMADGYALLGRKDDALRWVRKGIDNGFINYPNLTRIDRFLESLWGEPEFEALMAELKPRWEALIEWERGLRQ